jgi:hypothetical protein
MNKRRLKTLHLLAWWCGEIILQLIDPQNGWPSTIVLHGSDGPERVALHVGTIGKSGRGRDDVERRMQNPGKNKPIMAPRGQFPLLIGVWSEPGGPSICVGLDAIRRIGEETRKSFFVPLSLYARVQDSGWVEHVSTSGETIVVFHPTQLARYLEFRKTEATRGSKVTRLHA